MKIAISEYFHSIQGEGKSTGHPAIFIRLGGCNLMCGGHGTEKDGMLHNGAKWRCDTIEVWMKSRGTTVAQLVEDIAAMFNESELSLYERLQTGTHVIITGGEPLMQREAVEELIGHIKQFAPKTFFEIETNGTLLPSVYLTAHVNQWNISPKLSGSGMSPDKAIKRDILEYMNKMAGATFKFVISSKQDLEEVMRMGTTMQLRKEKMWLMAGADTRETLNELAPWLVEQCKIHGMRYSHRLHITLWDKKTGV